jgi:hypothetical protein
MLTPARFIHDDGIVHQLKEGVAIKALGPGDELGSKRVEDVVLLQLHPVEHRPERRVGDPEERVVQVASVDETLPKFPAFSDGAKGDLKPVKKRQPRRGIRPA